MGPRHRLPTQMRDLEFSACFFWRISWSAFPGDLARNPRKEELQLPVLGVGVGCSPACRIPWEAAPLEMPVWTSVKRGPQQAAGDGSSGALNDCATPDEALADEAMDAQRWLGSVLIGQGELNQFAGGDAA